MAELGTAISAPWKVRITVERIEISRMKPVVSPNSIWSPTFSFPSISRVRPLVRLRVSSCRPKPIPTPRAPNTTARAPMSRPIPWATTTYPRAASPRETSVATASRRPSGRENQSREKLWRPSGSNGDVNSFSRRSNVTACFPPTRPFSQAKRMGAAHTRAIACSERPSVLRALPWRVLWLMGVAGGGTVGGRGWRCAAVRD